jgi:hypothetical protein
MVAEVEGPLGGGGDTQVHLLKCPPVSPAEPVRAALQQALQALVRAVELLCATALAMAS